MAPFSNPQPRRCLPRSDQATIGQLGEDLVAQWLEQQGWQIVQRRWHCRWGEIDLIALQPPTAVPLSQHMTTIAFVEVKTRRSANWDAGGLLAITPQKQRKLHQTAALFLMEHPELANHACRFDVALLTCDRRPRLQQLQPLAPQPSIQLQQPVTRADYCLTLHQYLESAFTIVGD